MDIETAGAEVERLIKRSIVFGCIWLMGIGSLICILSALKAARLAKESGIEKNLYTGRLYLLGAVGLAISVSSIIVIIMFRKGNLN